MKMGEITAVQAGSPAAAAGIMAGDVIRKVDGNPVADPMTFPAQTGRRRRQDGGIDHPARGVEDADRRVGPRRRPMEASSSKTVDSPVGVESLGIAYRVLNRVDRVIEGSPAAKAGLLPEDLLVRAELAAPDKETLRTLGIDPSDEFVKLSAVDVKFSEKQRNWPVLIARLQDTVPGTTVKLTVLRQDKEQNATLAPVEAADWYNPDRGFLFEPMMFQRKATSVGDAFLLGGQETLDSLTIVFRTVGALGTAQVSPRNLGGPWMIIQMALHAADQGYAKLLLFLTMLSANLAVLNFLPIPLLDGGLMMFLIYEGIRGKPADERVQVVLTYLGLIFIVGLMVWVLGLDFGLISRR